MPRPDDPVQAGRIGVNQNERAADALPLPLGEQTCERRIKWRIDLRDATLTLSGRQGSVAGNGDAIGGFRDE